MILGLTGPMASGKNTVIGALKKKGFKRITMSNVIREEMDKQGIPTERAKMQDFSNAMKKKEGGGIWARRCIEKAKKEGWKNWVIDGIRNPAEIDELKKDPSFVLIAIMLSENEIVKRILARKRDIDSKNASEIIRELHRDWGEDEPPEGQQVGLCVRRADYVFDNSIPLNKVEKEFMKLYDRIVHEKGFNP